MSIPRALLLGSSGRLPFNGHLRVSRLTDGVRLQVAARVAHGAPPPEAWEAVCAAYAALAAAEGHDRWQLCRDAWERLLAVDRGRLGPASGADLSLLMVTEDAGGETISGVGLAALHTLERGELRPVVPAGHPLLGAAGLPTQPPNVLSPARPGPVYVGRCAALSVAEPPARGVLEACGVRA
ncbi:MAG: hypothetical protein H6741_30075 [Alphaproteobacteria bacterium]|nr:hypothetical protein [Alphaproteobacteria bacterium]